MEKEDRMEEENYTMEKEKETWKKRKDKYILPYIKLF